MYLDPITVEPPLSGLVVCDIGYFLITIIAHNISRYTINHSASVFILITLVVVLEVQYNIVHN